MKPVVLPEIGEGIEGGTVINLTCEVGQSLELNQTILELETDKAVVDVPCREAGKIKEILVREGTEIKVGDPLLFLEEVGVAQQETSGPSNKQLKQTELQPKLKSSFETSNELRDELENKEMVIKLPQIGEGIDEGTVVSILKEIGDQIKSDEAMIELETDKAVVPVTPRESGKILSFSIREGEVLKVGEPICKLEVVSSDSVSKLEKPVFSEPPSEVFEPSRPSFEQPPSENSKPDPDRITPGSAIIWAGPATRKLARELGVDLSQVVGTKRGGRIDQQDVKNYTKSLVQNRSPQNEFSHQETRGSELPDFSVFGEVEIKRASSLRRTIAKHMSHVWSTVPHVHQFDEVKVDQILGYQKKYHQDFKTKGSSLSLTIFLIKALARALEEFPIFNSSYDPIKQEIHYKKYFNIGVAVDTPEGLIVPVIKQVDQLDVFQIGVNLRNLAEKTRSRKVLPTDLKGASITLSNLGGIGGTHFTPIINAPEVAILGVGKNVDKVVAVEDPSSRRSRFKVSSYLPICLAYDHRVIDGADGARLITYLKNLLESPEKILLGGLGA